MPDTHTGLGDLDDLPDVRSPIIIIKENRIEEMWVPVVHRYGVWVPLFPRYFPVSGSKQECLDRVRIKIGSDPVFKKRWWGWNFAAVPVHDQVMNR